MEEPGGLQSRGSQRVGHDWATSLHSSWELSSREPGPHLSRSSHVSSARHTGPGKQWAFSKCRVNGWDEQRCEMMPGGFLEILVSSWLPEQMPFMQLTCKIQSFVQKKKTVSRSQGSSVPAADGWWPSSRPCHLSGLRIKSRLMSE